MRSFQERRVTVRYPAQRSVFCQAGPGRSDQFWHFAKMIDLSLGGACLVLSHGFAAGTMLLIEIADTNGGFTLTLPARVAHATEESSGWVVGCSFERALSDEELQRLL